MSNPKNPETQNAPVAYSHEKFVLLPPVGAAEVLMSAAAVASLMPAARASRVDVVQALRSE